MKTTVTIGIPVYNERNNIGTILTQLLEEDFPPHMRKNIFVCIDGSTDGSKDVVSEVQEKYPHDITMVTLGKRYGKANALNLIRGESSSPILCFIDGDIRLESGTLHHLLDLENCEDVYASSGNLIRVQGNHRFPMGHFNQIFSKRVEASRPYRRFVNGRLFAIKRDRMPFLPLSIGEDHYMTLTLGDNHISMNHDTVAYFHPPGTLRDLLRYKIRLRINELKIRELYPELAEADEERNKILGIPHFYDMPEKAREASYQSFTPKERLLYPTLVSLERLALLLGYIHYKFGASSGTWSSLSSTKSNF